MTPRTGSTGPSTAFPSRWRSKHAFFDRRRVIAEDLSHSASEQRYFCFGRVGDGIMTVRFTWREKRIRIIGAGYWRKGKTIYEQQNR